MSCDVTQFTLEAAVNCNKYRDAGFYSSTLWQYNNVFAGSTAMLVLGLTSIFLTKAFLAAADQDTAQLKLLQNNINQGLCISKGLDDADLLIGESPYEPAQSGIDCSQGNLTTIVGALSMAVTFFGLTAAGKMRANAVSQISKQEFNNAAYDDLLNEICQPEKPIIWSTQINVMDTNASLRTLVLGLLCSFDQNAFKAIFENILPKLDSTETIEFTISNIDYKIELLEVATIEKEVSLAK